MARIGDSIPKDFPGVMPVLAKPRELHKLARRINGKRIGFSR